MKTSVLVIGAGLAGLSAADALVGYGRRVEVWEARDRVGGRTLTRDVQGAQFDLGAQWIGPGQDRMHALARRFGLTTFPTFTDGASLLIDEGSRRSYRGTVPLMGPLQLGRLGLGLEVFRRMARDAGPLTDDDDAVLGRLDRRTLDSVLDFPLSHGTARRTVDAAIKVIFGAEPEELSARWAGAYAAAATGSLLQLAAIEGGAQQTRLVQGTQSFSRHLADEILRAGGQVHLERPVATIAQDQDGVVVTDRSGHQVSAERVIITVPPPLVQRIRFTPELPADRMALQARMPMGATTKVIAVYQRPFWREQGLRGEAVLTDGPVQVIFDNTSADGAVPALLGFVTGADAIRLSAGPAEQVEEEVLTAFIRAFGLAAGSPSHVVVQQWQHEEFSGGCPVSNPIPGALGRYGHTLRQPIGRLHWAGTETSTDWTGYMEGAVASGRRAAQEVLHVVDH